MSFDRDALLQATAEHGAVARILVVGVNGSAPREAGTSMLVWQSGTAGTIGGGALEWQAIAAARAQMEEGAETRLVRLPLGPALGQCCGGAVTLVTELWNADRLASLSDDQVIARPIQPNCPMPLPVRRMLARARSSGELPPLQLGHGWLIEPVTRPEREIWIWGAGHVGRALVAVLSPLPGLRITWIDTARDRFPTSIPAGVRQIVAAEPARLAPHAPAAAEHLILTFSHEIDFALCHALLLRGFRSCGLIGSATKWARFRSRLAKLGHTLAEIDGIACPIGDPTLGKHPQAIAVGVAARLLKQEIATRIAKESGR